MKEFKEAYNEALCARKNAFATSKFITEYSQIESEKVDVSDAKIDQFVQMIGTNRLSEAQKFLAHILYKTKQGQISPDIFSHSMTRIVEKICFNYRNILDIQRGDIATLKNIYGFDDAENYFDTLWKWIESIHGKIATEFDDYKNKQKIQKVLVYIHENYNKNLNMAVVSNYVSMNYSLFSSAFKQYTGMNFVDYIKTLRIKEAKKLLEETDMKIFEISNLIGYENEKNFMKVFKKDCGVSPREYRKNIQIGRA
jgi:YesN/AraC family two-component response regulator